jgi:LacI family transcriptional regulator
MMVSIIEKIAFQKNFQLVVNNVDNEFAKLKEYFLTLINNKSISGTIFFPSFEVTETKGKNNELLNVFSKHDIPVVLVDNLTLGKDMPEQITVTDIEYDYVIPDNFHGGYLAGRHLTQLGHKKIAFFGASINQAGFLRQQGYVKALNEYNIQVDKDFIVRVDNYGQIELVLTSLLSKGVTAIFAEHDLIAFEIYNQLKKMNIAVPQDVSLVGYDDLKFAEYLAVPLTTVRQPVEQEIELATEILFNKIEHKTDKIKQVILPVELIIRKSTERYVTTDEHG